MTKQATERAVNIQAAPSLYKPAAALPQFVFTGQYAKIFHKTFIGSRSDTESFRQLHCPVIIRLPQPVLKDGPALLLPDFIAFRLHNIHVAALPINNNNIMLEHCRLISRSFSFDLYLNIYHTNRIVSSQKR